MSNKCNVMSMRQVSSQCDPTVILLANNLMSFHSSKLAAMRFSLIMKR